MQAFTDSTPLLDNPDALRGAITAVCARHGWLTRGNDAGAPPDSPRS
jgi:hypothetical protein